MEALKRELKARAITYAQVARAIGMSEASVKRMFSQESFTLKRFDEVCRLADVEIGDLARAAESKQREISQLSLEQEREIVGNRKLFLVAVCALNHFTFEQIRATYDLTEPELVRLLARLDRLKFIELAPGNRIRLLVSRTFSWLPDGPIQQFFKSQAQHEFFQSRFDREGELMLFVNSMLSRGSAATMIERLKQVANECSALHKKDVGLPLDKRFGHSLLVAIRPWNMEAFRGLERAPATGVQVRRSVLAK
ncbi:MAG TPA: helix-turn-helix transcriptional regulator [Burkholderiales bacterium]|nr:helix-turn-helix transcriptional regulator [Burkholderiales bacterium]